MGVYWLHNYWMLNVLKHDQHGELSMDHGESQHCYC